VSVKLLVSTSILRSYRHEMRNPLSAILQCSDEISTSLIAYKAANPESRSEEQLVEILEGSIDASQTIALCAQHQKRENQTFLKLSMIITNTIQGIVDDILTLSKLDSALLAVTPVDVYPVEVVQRALKMFEGELETNDISMQFQIEQSYLDLQVGRVKLDPSRLLQVLINLTTNAIKFSAGAEKRTIVVTIGASSERPSGTESGVTYFPSRSKTKDMTTDDAEWGTGDNIFLLFAVADTGRGLDEQEKVLLFQRFRQASPRTHVQYGGSGLGLFISRELTELQGGEIGVASERGVGSTFAFYVRARKVRNDPEDATVANKMSTLRRNSSNSAVVMDTRRGSSGKSASRSSGNEPIHRKRSPNTSVEIARVDSPGPSLDFGKTKVLIVEDNLVNQKVLQKQLKNVGFLVEVANHGGEALDILRTSRFWNGNERNGNDLAVVLMDLEMPIMDGLTATMKIRELETAGTIVKHVPIIAVTANARLEQIETAMSAGMVRCHSILVMWLILMWTG
jgi:signal transduction histidine kinase